jgi:CRISPR-associated endonuclease Csn1
MKNILGLDLGTTSIGFAHVIESEDPSKSVIKQIGVRVNPLSTEEQKDFEKGKPITINADRTLKRGARRNLDRYQDRRSNLIHALSKGNIITKETKLAEDGKDTTHSTWRLRSQSATEKIGKDDLARVLLAINKKRGYKSSRKAKNEDEGQAIDGMEVAKRLYEEVLTPGQFAYKMLQEGKKNIPDFYRSDLQNELEKVWTLQKKHYPDIFTDEFKKELEGKGQRATSALFWVKYQFNTAENKGSREEKKVQAYKWRSEAFCQQLEKEEVAYVITDINNNLNNSSGYLGAISDRSKELYFNRETVGQFLFKQLLKNPNTRLKNQVFYRQDYLDEFEAIWNEQKKHHPELTDELKIEIRDIVIFYQRKLKSQKGLVSFCEFESREIEIENGKKKTIGLKVTPKSSPLFQEFKIWQVLHNVLIKKKGSKKRIAKNEKQVSLFEVEKEIFSFDEDEKKHLFHELNIKGNLSAKTVLEILGYKSQDWEINYTVLEGNRTNKALYEAYLKILDNEGYDVKELLEVKSNKDEVELDDIQIAASKIKNMIKQIFESLKIDTAILDFNPELDGKEFEQQLSYQLWHLLYSYEGDESASGNEKLYELLEKKFGFKRAHSQVLANVALSDDYGSLSSKAIRKIYPFIQENDFSTACELAEYRHSAFSLTKEEITNRPLKDKLEILKKNSLRNPVVEKILNQMVNVVNALIEKNSKKDENGNIVECFKFDEIRIELARDLKKNAKERAEMTSSINAAKSNRDKIFKLLQNEFGVKNPSRNDIIRYRLYEELKSNGYKDLYTDTYISREILFSKQIDIEHIIPQSKLFDDSFSNKTVVFRKDNLEKGNKTAYDYLESKFGEKGLEDFESRISSLFDLNKRNKDEGISRAKYQKLLKKETEIGDGFIERDLRDSQYIAKKAKNILYEISRSVLSTTGSVTNKLREDWDLINIMQELNFEKFKKLGLTEMVEKKDGTFKERIKDWSKRNDHRHHAMDALTVAFTRHNHIQYLNNLNARKNESKKLHNNIIGIETKETHLSIDDRGNKKRIFNLPIPNFREQAKEHLENVLVSHKAKNKVVTKNKNKTKTGKGEKVKVELTPRGKLHDQTVYGYRSWSRIELSKKVSRKEIESIIDRGLQKFLIEHIGKNGSISKAFSDEQLKKLQYRGKSLLEIEVSIPCYTQRIDISKVFTDSQKTDSAKSKSIKSILDLGVRKILNQRLKDFNFDFKKAFSDLDRNSIWLNKEKGISIRRVTISGTKNAEPLHFKKNHFGIDILDNGGSKILVDFVSKGSNHHLAVYRDENGNLQDDIVSFFDAVELGKSGESIVNKYFNQGLGWQFLFSMKQNEYFVFPNEKQEFYPIEIDLLNPENAKIISPNLFRVQKISKVIYGNSAVRDYVFRHHLETTVDDKKELKEIAFKSIKSLGYFENVVKVRLNHLGEIIKVGEY